MLLQPLTRTNAPCTLQQQQRQECLLHFLLLCQNMKLEFKYQANVFFQGTTSFHGAARGTRAVNKERKRAEGWPWGRAGTRECCSPRACPAAGLRGFSCPLASALENSEDVRADLCRVENPAHRSASAIFCRFSPAGVFGWSPVPLTFVSFCLR